LKRVIKIKADVSLEREQAKKKSHDEQRRSVQRKREFRSTGLAKSREHQSGDGKKKCQRKDKDLAGLDDE
jgi:hypothetical protein